MNPKKRTKYGNKGFFYSRSTDCIYEFKALPDCVYFPSKWEHRVYMAVRGIIPDECIQLHVNVPMKPKTERYPAIDLNVDIVTLATHNYQWVPHLLIEPKGVPTDEFKLKLKLLEYFNPTAYEKFLIIGDYEPLKIDERMSTIQLHVLLNFLQSFRIKSLSVS